jgi:lysozyme
VTPQGKQNLIELEGLRCNAYPDETGRVTIGVGHCLSKDEYQSGTILIGGVSVDFRNGLTEEQVLALLDEDLVRFAAVVAECVKVPLTDSQTDALTCFSFNEGVNAFRQSTLLKKLNAGLYDAVPDELRRWNIAGGKVSKGLVNRREVEIALWSAQTTTDLHPSSAVDTHPDIETKEGPPVNLGKIFKPIARVGDNVVQIADLIGVPGAAQVDALVRVIQNSKADAHEKEAALAKVETLTTLPIVIPVTTAPAADEGAVKFYESKRFLMVAAGIVATVLARWGLQEAAAEEVTKWVAGLVAAYVAGDTIRPSTKSN